VSLVSAMSSMHARNDSSKRLQIAAVKEKSTQADGALTAQEAGFNNEGPRFTRRPPQLHNDQNQSPRTRALFF
jgi:hypothetical protein